MCGRAVSLGTAFAVTVTAPREPAEAGAITRDLRTPSHGAIADPGTLFRALIRTPRICSKHALTLRRCGGLSFMRSWALPRLRAQLTRITCSKQKRGQL